MDTHVYTYAWNNRRRHCLNLPLSRRATLLCVGMLTPLDHSQPICVQVVSASSKPQLTSTDFVISTRFPNSWRLDDSPRAGPFGVKSHGYARVHTHTEFRVSVNLM